MLALSSEISYSVSSVVRYLSVYFAVYKMSAIEEKLFSKCRVENNNVSINLFVCYSKACIHSNINKVNLMELKILNKDF